MQRLTLGIILLLCTVAAMASGAPAEWTARYTKLVKTFTEKDMKGLSAMLADDVVWVQVDGTKKNREEMLADFGDMFKSSKIAAHEKLLHVVKRGDIVDVHCEVFMKLDDPGKTQMVFHSFCVDSWKKIGGKWVIVKTVDQKVEMTGGK